MEMRLRNLEPESLKEKEKEKEKETEKEPEEGDAIVDNLMVETEDSDN